MPNGNDKEIFDRLGKIEQTLARIDERTKSSADMRVDFEKRLRALEDKEARRGGILAALTAIGSAVGTAIMWLIQHVTGVAGQ